MKNQTKIKNMMKILRYDEFLYESSKEMVINVDGDLSFVDKLIDSISFKFHKRASRYFRPFEISGVVGENINLKIKCNHKYNIGINYTDDEIIIRINDEIVYHFDDFKRYDIIPKVKHLLIKDLKGNGFNVTDNNI